VGDIWGVQRFGSGFKCEGQVHVKKSSSAGKFEEGKVPIINQNKLIGRRGRRGSADTTGLFWVGVTMEGNRR